ncbi:short chain dehydrogenase reductase family [Colletotrichum incanum]|uniref:Short chain dehydrogenase reductase family n=1 Tax=Colletotrichum incanum TaxID=1573173 RepID=A0A166RZM7_COLIC|nr:short chain dehydrogenase reductase family [Colletotrichum incanum]OHW97355.1 short chain dehydrogenase reductase family protein [Colletotrichum incanum]
MAPKYVNKLEGKSVIIVGGTSGIGFAVAEASVEFGARVVVASRSQERVDKTIKRLTESYPDAKDRIRGHIVNLHGDESETSIKKLFEFATNEDKDKIDHVVETAGEAPDASLTLQDATPQRITEASSSRFPGVVVLAKVASKYLKKDYTSSFTITGGAATYKPSQGWAVLAAIGGAKDALARGLAVDMAPVRVNLVSPGATQTELMAFAFDNLKFGDLKADPEVVRDMFRSTSLLNRIGDPEDLAETYLSLMKNYFVTGTTLHVDGGKLLK